MHPDFAAATPPGQDIMLLIPANGLWYVHINDAAADADHNDHLVVAWGLVTDKRTLIPYITDLTTAETLVQVPTISTDYTILNPYSECPTCVRPEVTRAGT
jgi:hypothetical protein